jgi:thiol-disulfide isomerase/thioredoxin/Tfp pilus assembly protein PilF
MQLALAAALVVAITMSAPTPNGGFLSEVPSDARKALDRAHAAIIAGELAPARAELERVVARAPRLARGYDLLARTLTPARREAEARRFAAAAEASPNDPVNWYAFAQFTRDKSAKRAAIERVVALAPMSPWGYYAKAQLAVDESRYGDAFELFEKALALAPSETAASEALVMATQYYVVNDPGVGDAAARIERARRAFASLRAVAPRSPEALNAAGALSDLVTGAELLELARYFLATFPSAASVGWAHNVVLADVRAREPAAVRAAARASIARMLPLHAPFAAYWRDRIFAEYVLDSAVFLGPAALGRLAREAPSWKEATPGALLALADACASNSATSPLAFRIYERGLELYKNGREPRGWVGDKLRLALGRAYANAGVADRAAQLLGEITTPESVVEAAPVLGRVYLALGDAAKAFEQFVAAAALNPSADNETGLLDAARLANRSSSDAMALVWERRDASSRPAPDFTLKDLDGNDAALSSLRGKVVLLTFWFPNCAPCRSEFPHLQRLVNDLRGRGLEVLAFDVEDDAVGARRFIEQRRITFRSLRGSRDLAKRLFDVEAVPTTLLIDRSGRVVFSHVGFDGERAATQLRREAEALLGRAATGEAESAHQSR